MRTAARRSFGQVLTSRMPAAFDIAFIGGAAMHLACWWRSSAGLRFARLYDYTLSFGPMGSHLTAVRLGTRTHWSPLLLVWRSTRLIISSLTTDHHSDCVR